MKPLIALLLALLSLSSLPADPPVPNQLPPDVVQKIKLAGLSNGYINISSELKIGTLATSNPAGEIHVSTIQDVYSSGIPATSAYSIRFRLESGDKSVTVINVDNPNDVVALLKIDSSMFQFPDYSAQISYNTGQVKITGAYDSTTKLKSFTFQTPDLTLHLTEDEYKAFADLAQKAQKAIDAQTAAKGP